MIVYKRASKPLDALNAALNCNRNVVEAKFHGVILGIIHASVCPTCPQTLPLVAKLNFRVMPYKRAYFGCKN
jgi:hypothetical protein